MQLKKVKDFLLKIKENWKDLKWWREKYRDKIFVKLISRKNKGTYILDEEWDHLIILDGCRYDIFKELNTIKGELEWRISRGSCTKDFLLENFKKYPDPQKLKKKLKEIVYVTGNPTVNLLLSEAFYKIFSTWDYGWDEKLCTVPPENIVKDALFAKEDNPGKKLIVHFVQPHCPFLGGEIPIENLRDSVRERALGKKDLPKPEEDIAIMQPSLLIESGKLEKEIVWKAYIHNLQIVLPFVQKLIDHLSGKIVVTSDHGEIMGERVPHILYPFREYGHPCGLYIIENLVKVPWLIVKK
jgi:hypothetical protein